MGESTLLPAVLVLLTTQLVLPLAAQTCDLSNKVPCAGDSQEQCENHGCCWAQNECFFQTPKYIVKSISNTTFGKKVMLEADNLGRPGLPASPVSPVEVEFTLETTRRLHVRILDRTHGRYEIPARLVPRPPVPTKNITYADYDIKIPAVGEEFYFSVFRQYYNTSIFNTSTIGLYVSEQYLSIGTKLSKGFNIYGLGEHKTQLKIKPNSVYTLWNYDTATPKDLNLYGSHPFYMEVTDDYAHGVYLRNSNGMDVEIGETSLIYRVIGGVLDFYFFLGEYPGPDSVVQQYQEVIGRPAMPPYWALGFHQCRWGYENLQDVKDVVENYAKNEIPLDTMWTDIDYMDKYMDFTTDPVSFPSEDMKTFIEDLHMKGQHYVLIVDPAISNAPGYKPFEEGKEMDIFIRDREDKVFIGKVWPGNVAFPDFTDQRTGEYWKKQISAFLEKVPADGLWLDMNEPSNFCDGECKDTSNSSSRSSKLQEPHDFGHPPYAINNQGRRAPLNAKTLDVNAYQVEALAHYNLHNLYGLAESMETYNALASIYKGKRPFVLSRSTFAGSGRYAAHWLGDNTASAEDMYYSIPGILNFQMFGIPLAGADICGFGGSTTEELCARWMELGAFYPFARNHNVKGAPAQEPYRWSSVAAISRKVLSLRYSLLPYYYSLFFMANHDPNDYMFYPSTGVVVKPLFFDFPRDTTSLSIDKQFLVGSALLISPQLELGDVGMTLDVYLPPATWYDWYTLDAVTRDGSTTRTVQTPLDYISIHVRGGYIVPMQEPGLTTAESRKNPYSLLVALEGGRAEGYLYLDDGETFNATEYTFISYSCYAGGLTTDISGTKYATKYGLPLLTKVTVTGLVIRPTVVALNGEPIKYTLSEGETFKLFVNDLAINMDSKFQLVWV